MPTSDEELEKLQQDNEKLREQIASERSKQSENEAERVRELAKVQLEAENQRLQNQLAAAKEASKVAASREAVAPTLDAAKEQLAAARAQAEVGVGPVDPNPPGETTEKDKQNGGNS